MPASVQKQFDQIVPIEARKYIPVPISEVTLDWWLIPKALVRPIEFGSDKPPQELQNEKIEVLLVAIHNETLSRYQSIINNAKLQASFFEIEIFSTIRSVTDQDATSQMIVDLGAASSKIYIVEQGIIRASHIVNRGAQDVTLALSRSLGVSVQNAEIIKRDLNQVPPDKKADVASVISLTLDYIFSEAHQVMLSYQRKYNRDVPKATIVGGGAMLKGVLEYAESRLQCQVVLGDPFGKTEAPAFLMDVLKTTGPEFAVAVGVALRKLMEFK
jgi:type IV pilus assembly protein PilM